MSYRQPLYIMLCADENYIKYASVVLLSLVAHTKENIECYLVVPKSPPSFICKNLQSLESDYLHIHIVEQSQEPFLHLFAQGEGNNHITYLRLLLDMVLPSYVEKCLYLDCDVLVCSDIKELYSIDLGDKLLGAVRDLAYQDASCHVANHKDFYFNAGVLLINVALWRAMRATEILFDIITNKPDIALGHYDQNLLNACFANLTLELPLEWNAIYIPPFLLSFTYSFPPECHQKSQIKVYKMFEGEFLFSRHSQDAYQRALENPKIVHFASSSKPWERVCYIRENTHRELVLIKIENPYAKLWRKVAKKSPFYQEIKKGYMRSMYLELKTHFVYWAKSKYPKIYEFLHKNLRRIG